jgi:hypothetical protein
MDAQPRPEFVRSAVRSAQHIGATVVWTSHDRWLLLTGYGPQYRAWAARGIEGLGDGPRVDACTILRGATKAEFYGACNTIDPAPYREELTEDWPKLEAKTKAGAEWEEAQKEAVGAQ